MNLLAWAEHPTELRSLGVPASFCAVTSALTLYTVVKSRRLSEFLDALSDEQVGWRGKLKALMRSGGLRSGRRSLTQVSWPCAVSQAKIGPDTPHAPKSFRPCQRDTRQSRNALSGAAPICVAATSVASQCCSQRAAFEVWR